VKEEILFASTVLLIALGDIALKTGIESIIANFDRSIAPPVATYWLRG
jgi:hypothetical protein